METGAVVTPEIAKILVVLIVIAPLRAGEIHGNVTDVGHATVAALAAAQARLERARASKREIRAETGVALRHHLAVPERRAPTCSVRGAKPPAEVLPHQEDSALHPLAHLGVPKHGQPVLRAAIERLLRRYCKKRPPVTVLLHRAAPACLLRQSLALPAPVRQEDKEMLRGVLRVAGKVQTEGEVSALRANSRGKTVRRRHVGRERHLRLPVPARPVEVALIEIRFNFCLIDTWN